jgi:Tol biopolymer transport system component
MAECYQKMGATEARKIYEQVLREYGDQKEAVAEARARLGDHTERSITARRVWSGPEVNSHGSVAADGRYLSYIDWTTGDLAIHNLQTGEDRRLIGNGRWTGDFPEASNISPDGRMVAYSWYTSKPEHLDLRVVAIMAGGESVPPRIIYSPDGCCSSANPVGWVMGGEGVLAYTQGSRDGTHQFIVVSLTGGNTKVLKSFDWRSINKASVSPDGRYVAYDFPPKEDSAQHDIYVLAVDGSRESRAVENPADDLLVGWSPDGKALLFASDRTGTTDLWAVPMADGKAAGDPELLKRDVGRMVPLGVSVKGALYYGVTTGIRDVYTVAIDPRTLKPESGPALASRRFLSTNNGADWSPDGKYLAWASKRGQVWDSPSLICIHSLANGTERDIVPRLSRIIDYLGIRWTPDGRAIVVRGVAPGGREGLYRVDAQTGDTELLTLGVTSPPVWSPDARTMYYLRAVGSDRSTRIMALNLQDRSERELYKLRVGYFGPIAISPDGRYLAFEDNPPPGEKMQRISLLPLGGGEPRILVEAPGIRGFVGLAWTPDGEQILFVKPAKEKSANDLWRVSVRTGDQCFVAEYAEELGVRALRISPDGRKVSFRYGKIQEEIWALENFLPRAKARN